MEDAEYYTDSDSMIIFDESESDPIFYEGCSEPNEDETESAVQVQCIEKESTSKHEPKSHSTDGTEKAPLHKNLVARDKSHVRKTGNKDKNARLARIRYDGIGHLPKAEKNKNVKHRCKLEHCESRAHIFCVKCEVHLCCSIKNDCFYEFHIKKKILRTNLMQSD